ncbi:MAG: DUF2892 domain-containing protein [Rhodobacterales bacterium]|nr:DUF2892 domain-containing protein [Rhodobacterales bacterium]
MSKNVGSFDRILRIVVGLALIAFAIFGAANPYAVYAWIGVVPLLTGLIGFCPAYTIFGIRTCPTAKS